MKAMLEIGPGLRMAFEHCGNSCPPNELTFETDIQGDREVHRIRCAFCDRKTEWHGNLAWIQSMWNGGHFNVGPTLEL